MPNLDDILSDAQGGEGMDMLGREFGLTPDQTQAAVTALLPAISTGLKRATATPEGLSSLLALMSQQPLLRVMYDDPDTAFAQPGRNAGNDVLSVIFGSPDVSRAVAERAQLQSGIASSVLKKLLPVIVGMLISGMLGRKSSEASPPSAPTGTPAGSGGIWDILEQVFGRAMTGSSGTAPNAPPQMPAPADQQLPNSGGPAAPGGDLIAVILRELQKAIQEGRPVVVQAPTQDGQSWPMPSDTPIPGAGDAPLPGSKPSLGTAPGGEMLPGPKMTPNTQAPGGDILGNILHDIFGGAGAGTRASQAGLGAAVFGDRIETGSKIDEKDQANLQALFDQVFGDRRR
jgi:hypothetical protein